MEEKRQKKKTLRKGDSTAIREEVSPLRFTGRQEMRLKFTQEKSEMHRKIREMIAKMNGEGT